MLRGYLCNWKVASSWEGLQAPEKTEFSQGLMIQKNKWPENWVCFHEVKYKVFCASDLAGRGSIENTWIAFGHRLNVTPVLCPCKAGKCPVGMYKLWLLFSLGGSPASLHTAEGSAGGFGLLWHQFHKNGLIRESPGRTDRNNPRSWSKKITKKDWKRSQKRRGEEASEPSGKERETAQTWTAASEILAGNLEACWWEKGFPTCSVYSHPSKNGWKTTV